MSKVYSVSELNALVKGLIEGEPEFLSVYVGGELSNYKLYPSGHHYFTLKDSESVLKCVMFKGNASKLRFKPESGMRVIAGGRLSVYPRDGVYQLYCATLTPDGIGALYLAFEQLKEKLYREGLFNESVKKPLPAFPSKIAVVTSPAGAAVRDVIRILNVRFPVCEVLVVPVRVQGEEAPEEIAGAIGYVNRHALADLIITGRGGGSIEDLWAFNDERVARAIYASDIPVISAVGHEPDVSIADFVADRRAATPSNAAEIAVPDMAELRLRLMEYESRAQYAVSHRLIRLRERVAAAGASRVLRSPLAYFADRRTALSHREKLLRSSALSAVSGEAKRLSGLAGALDAMSPLKVLGRGYGIVSGAGGRTIRSYRDAEAGEKILVRLSKGALGCTVDEVIK